MSVQPQDLRDLFSFSSSSNPSATNSLLSEFGVENAMKSSGSQEESVQALSEAKGTDEDILDSLLNNSGLKASVCHDSIMQCSGHEGTEVVRTGHNPPPPPSPSRDCSFVS